MSSFVLWSYRSIVFPCLLSRVLLYAVVIYTNYKVSWFDLVPLHNETILFRLVFLCAILHIFLFIIYVNVVFSKSNVVHVVCFLVSFPLYILCSEMTSSKQSEIKNLHSRHVDSQTKQSDRPQTASCKNFENSFLLCCWILK